LEPITRDGRITDEVMNPLHQCMINVAGQLMSTARRSFRRIVAQSLGLPRSCQSRAILAAAHSSRNFACCAADRNSENRREVAMSARARPHRSNKRLKRRKFGSKCANN
jgi:hypothetical protein